MYVEECFLVIMALYALYIATCLFSYKDKLPCECSYDLGLYIAILLHVLLEAFTVALSLMYVVCVLDSFMLSLPLL